MILGSLSSWVVVQPAWVVFVARRVAGFDRVS